MPLMGPVLFDNRLSICAISINEEPAEWPAFDYALRVFDSGILLDFAAFDYLGGLGIFDHFPALYE